ncbi:MAG: pantoate--beta-alanine ligase [Bacteroidales bacterium]|jgi:pantoate--beta-alanine ligase|nr:pantoate--beta-alanine ligase [Bacteroidales bacterium]
MKIISTAKELKEQVKLLKLSPLGFVPTMGALHNGHISLVINARRKCPLIVVSIYVNPTQFNDKEDLKNYPRTIEADLDLLNKHLRKEDIVFIPYDKEVYPTEDKRIFGFGNLDNVMESLHRPGHFNGVGLVVSRLFDIVRPDMAFFGLKDFQQVAVIKSLVRKLKFGVKIIACPIVREPDGLAMSSRNRLLEKDIRKRAPVIFKTISRAAEMFGENDVPGIKKFVKSTIEKEEGFRIEYFEIVDDIDLIPIKNKRGIKKGKHYFGCIAVKAGKIRLIDNIEIPLA